MANATYEYGAWPPCDICGNDSEFRTRRDVTYCVGCYAHLRQGNQIPLKDLTTLVRDLREHAIAYHLDNGALRNDLTQAANYLEAIAND